MSDILSRQRVSVETDCDRVIFTVRRTQFPIPYATAFKIAAHLKMVCKQSMRISYEPLNDWDKRMGLDREIPVNEISPERRSTAPLERYEWRIDTEGEMIYIWFGNTSVGFHFESALKISHWLRLAARQSKNWAGDTGKAIHTVGTLSNAEENYKRGYQ